MSLALPCTLYGRQILVSSRDVQECVHHTAGDPQLPDFVNYQNKDHIKLQHTLLYLVEHYESLIKDNDGLQNLIEEIIEVYSTVVLQICNSLAKENESGNLASQIEVPLGWSASKWDMKVIKKDFDTEKQSVFAAISDANSDNLTDKPSVRQSTRKLRQRKQPHNAIYKYQQDNDESLTESQNSTCRRVRPKTVRSKQKVIASVKRDKKPRPLWIPVTGLCDKTNSQKSVTPINTNKPKPASPLCTLCGKIFRYNSLLKAHVNRVHTSVKYPCTTCAKYFNTKASRARHENIHHRKLKNGFECRKCSAKFKTITMWTSHNCSNGKADVQLYCMACDKLMISQSQVKEHKCIKKSGSFGCSWCSKKFKSRSYWKDHEAMHDGKKFECHTCNKSFVSSRTLKFHMFIHKPDSHLPCEKCGKMFSTHRLLQQHIVTHNDPSHKCSQCNKLFKSARNMVRHVETTHKFPSQNPDSFILCSICGKRVFSQSELFVHIRRFHTKELPFQCTYCEKKFVCKGDQRKHERVHTGEKKFQCHVCPKKFRDSSTLCRHLHTHLSFKPFCCKICGDGVTQLTTFKKHAEKHGYCGKEYKDILERRIGKSSTLKNTPNLQELPEPVQTSQERKFPKNLSATPSYSKGRKNQKKQVDQSKKIFAQSHQPVFPVSLQSCAIIRAPIREPMQLGSSQQVALSPSRGMPSRGVQPMQTQHPNIQQNMLHHQHPEGLPGQHQHHQQLNTVLTQILQHKQSSQLTNVTGHVLGHHQQHLTIDNVPMEVRGQPIHIGGQQMQVNDQVHSHGQGQLVQIGGQPIQIRGQQEQIGNQPTHMTMDTIPQQPIYHQRQQPSQTQHVLQPSQTQHVLQPSQTQHVFTTQQQQEGQAVAANQQQNLEDAEALAAFLSAINTLHTQEVNFNMVPTPTPPTHNSQTNMHQ